MGKINSAFVLTCLVLFSSLGLEIAADSAFMDKVNTATQNLRVGMSQLQANANANTFALNNLLKTYGLAGAAQAGRPESSQVASGAPAPAQTTAPARPRAQPPVRYSINV
ncbi:hypothetical protein M5689_016453 [Euphorbia peplus]|nr:hypothetical protein M5689_016453 [Euphorbia peplus]